MEALDGKQFELREKNIISQYISKCQEGTFTFYVNKDSRSQKKFKLLEVKTYCLPRSGMIITGGPQEILDRKFFLTLIPLGADDTVVLFL